MSSVSQSVVPSSLRTVPVLQILSHHIPMAAIQAVVARSAHGHERCRKLPGELLVQLLIAVHLVPGGALDAALASLLVPTGAIEAVPSATASAISHARARWGVLPICRLWRLVARTLATPATRGAWWFDYRVLALDETYYDVADTPANSRTFGRHRTARGTSAYPQLLALYLIECGTHAVLAARCWPCAMSVHRAVRSFLRHLSPETLLLWDAGIHSYAFAAAVRQRCGAFLARVPAHQTFEPVVFCSDGTVLALFYAAPPSRRRTDTPRFLVRVITYTVPDPQHPDQRRTYRLMTSLLAPRLYPVAALLQGYHERWEIELVVDEQKTHQRLLPTPLRSRTPTGVIQEFYGLLLAHAAIRAWMHEAALAADCDPDRLSFARCRHTLGLQVSWVASLDAATWDARIPTLCRVLATFRLPPRRLRRAPRARKRSWLKHRHCQRTRHYAIVSVPPFLDTVALCPPRGPAHLLLVPLAQAA